MGLSKEEEIALWSVILFNNKSRRKQAKKNVVSKFVKYFNVVKSMKSSQT